MNRVIPFLKQRNIYNICIICIFVLAVLLRMNIVDTSRELREGSDEYVYHYAAENLIKFGALSYDRDGGMFNETIQISPTTVIPPGYPVFVAIIYFLFNHSVQAVLIIQFLLSIICLWIIYKMLVLIEIKKRYTILVLLLASVYPGFIYNIDRMLTEQLFTTCFVLYAYFFLNSIKKNSIFYLFISSLLLGLATHVRALAFPFLFLSCLFILIYEKENIREMLKKVSVVLFTILAVMIPWWIRNEVTFGDFMFFSNAGENPKIWGAVPYFIDMTSTYNQSLREIIQANLHLNKELFFKWRIFGFLQYMWGDLWDENLVHPHSILRPFLIIQQLILVPALAFIPFIMKRSSREIIFIACIPIAFTLMNMPFHGLPRYVFPATPFVFVLFGGVLECLGNFIKSKKKTTKNEYLYKWQKFIAVWFKRGLLILSSIFSIVLLYSVYIFSYNIGNEMSEHRLNKYMNTTSSKLASEKVLESIRYTTDDLVIENVESINENDKNKTYKNNLGGPTLIRLTDKSPVNFTDKNIVTEIKLDFHGGYIYDYSTIYWTGTTTPNFSEDKVYKFPINRFQKSHRIYVDDDVETLMIVPTVFSGGSFSINSIEIKKYSLN